ncbi:unnamed protein product, partial [Polarella glacialis]
QDRQRASGFGERVALHYGFALGYALKEHFVNARSLIVVEEDIVMAPDFLLYFAQLEPLLLKDDRLFCISAWNENALSPFVSSRSRLLRVDSFSGVAWMLSTSQFLREYLPRWPRNSWDKFFRRSKGRQDRQCIMPEMPRIQHIGDISDDRSAAKRFTSHTAARYFNGSGAAEQVAQSHLGNVSESMAHAAYRQQMWLELKSAKLVKSPAELPSPLDDDVGKAPESEPRPDLCWCVPVPAAVGSWDAVPGGLLLHAGPGRPEVSLPLEPVPLEAFRVGRSGESCAEFCGTQASQCLAADLVFINDCTTLKRFHYCERCEGNYGSDQPALVVGRQSQAYGACLYNIDPFQYPITCEAAHSDTRRLCVCRRPLLDLAATQALMLKPVPAVNQSNSSRSVAKKQADAAVIGDFHTCIDYSYAAYVPSAWQPGAKELALRPQGVADFADPGSWPASLASLNVSLSIVVLAGLPHLDLGTSKTSGQQFDRLRACLAALNRSQGFSPGRVLVVQDVGDDARQGDEGRQVAETEFGVSWVEHRAPDLSLEALDIALRDHFKGAPSILVLDDTVELGPDALWYFAQLEPTLLSDPSLWCVTAWNDVGLAPYVADPTALMRTDWFSGVAWMLPAKLFLDEMAPSWPFEAWREHFRSHAIRKGRQCVFPEVSRCSGGSVSHHDRTHGAWHVRVQNERRKIYLGDVSRLEEPQYERLYISGFPDSALSSAVGFQRLEELSLDQEPGTTRILTVESGTAGWDAVARYFRLPVDMAGGDNGILAPGLYKGSLRLR